MTVVLDASATAELILGRKNSDQINSILSNCKKAISSDLYKADITNVFWKYLKAGFITKQEAINFIKLSLELVEEYHDIKSFSIESLNEAIKLNHSTYDMLYLTLARRTGSILLTLDKELSKLAESEGISNPLL